MDPHRKGTTRAIAIFAALCAASPAFAQLDTDDFEGYLAGSYIAGQGSWTIWDSVPGGPGTPDSLVVDTFNSTPGGDNSLQLQPADDIVRVFGGLANGGAYTFTSNVYIPSGQNGDYYFLLLNRYQPFGPYEWSAQIHFDDTTGTAFGDSITIAGVGTFSSTPIVYNAWAQVSVTFDLSATWTHPTTPGLTGTGTYDAFYNGIQIVNDAAWLDAGGGILQMKALDLYNAGGGTFYYDDVVIECAGPCPCLPFDFFDVSIDCTTNDVELDWTTFQSGGYTGGISVLRNGVSIASLAGTATGYTDLAVPLGVHTYEVIGDCTGGQTAIASGTVACTGGPCPPPVLGDECCGAIPAVLGSNPFDTTTASDSPDATTPSQCTGTFFGVMHNDLWFSYTAAANSFIRVSTCPIAPALSFDTDLAVYEGSVGSCGTKVQIACNGDSCGLSSDLTFTATAGTEYLFRVGGWSSTTVGAASLEVSELCDPDLTGFFGLADCDTGDVTLTWDPGAFDSYEILRDGASIATLPAGSTSYLDLTLVAGSYDYEIIGECTAQGTSLSASTTVNVQVAYGVSDIILRLETAGGLVDSVAALQTALLAQPGVSLLVLDLGPGALSCLGDPVLERIWCCVGTFPADTTLTPSDEAALVVAQSLGKHIYIEAGDEWGFDGVTVLGDIDGIAPPYEDGDDSFASMDGADGGFGLDLSAHVGVVYTQDSAGNDYTDQLFPSATDALGPNAGVIWRQAGGAYNTGIHYDTNSGGKVICQSWEFGGFGGDQNALAAAYLAVFGGGVVQPGFKRGDTNNDGGVNIADAVWVLGALFPAPGGSPNALACLDASDGNDDGGINIADAVAILGSLFGSPTVPLPAPGTSCGVDPTTMDPLDCAGYLHCPP